jgi:NADH-quinone oxidoreductase subunit J
MISTILFYLFALIVIISALKVISAKNPVHSVLFLVLAFVTSSCLWLMLNVEFLALTLILVYVGAVMVLFLFVVMMLDVDTETLRSGFWKNLPLALALGLIVLIEMLLVIIAKPLVITPRMPDATNILAMNGVSNANQLGWVLYTEYSYPVELASMLLLLGLVVAVALTLRKSDKMINRQNISKQVAVNSTKGRIEMVKMDPVTEKIYNVGDKSDVGDSK